eukprot:gene10238-2394_t
MSLVEYSESSSSSSSSLEELVEEEEEEEEEEQVEKKKKRRRRKRNKKQLELESELQFRTENVLDGGSRGGHWKEHEDERQIGSSSVGYACSSGDVPLSGSSQDGAAYTNVSLMRDDSNRMHTASDINNSGKRMDERSRADGSLEPNTVYSDYSNSEHHPQRPKLSIEGDYSATDNRNNQQYNLQSVFATYKIQDPLATPSSFQVDPIVAKKVEDLLQTKRTHNINILEKITNNKQYRNPSIYEKLIQRMDIDEFGSNLDRSIYDPHKWIEDEFGDRLGDAQQSRHVAVQKAAHPTSPAIIDTAEMRRAIETATLKAKQLGEERFRQSDN